MKPRISNVLPVIFSDSSTYLLASSVTSSTGASSSTCSSNLPISPLRRRSPDPRLTDRTQALRQAHNIAAMLS